MELAVDMQKHLNAKCSGQNAYVCQRVHKKGRVRVYTFPRGSRQIETRVSFEILRVSDRTALKSNRRL